MVDYIVNKFIPDTENLEYIQSFNLGAFTSPRECKRYRYDDESDLYVLEDGTLLFKVKSLNIISSQEEFIAQLYHRIDGPARIWKSANGKFFFDFWINGEFLKFDTWLAISSLSDKEKIKLKINGGYHV